MATPNAACYVRLESTCPASMPPRPRRDLKRGGEAGGSASPAATHLDREPARSRISHAERSGAQPVDA